MGLFVNDVYVYALETVGILFCHGHAVELKLLESRNLTCSTECIGGLLKMTVGCVILIGMANAKYCLT